jgi:autotransporter-associated beta strand protein
MKKTIDNISETNVRKLNAGKSSRRSRAVSAAILTLPVGAGIGALVCNAVTTFGSTYVRTNTAGSLNDTNWLLNGVSGTPGASDIGQFSATAGGAQTDSISSTTLTSPFQLGELQVTNATGLVTITDTSNTLELMGVNGTGIDLSTATQNLTINSLVQLGSTQTWAVGSGRTVTIAGGVSDGGSNFGITKTGVGTVLFAPGSVNSYGGTLAVNGGYATDELLATSNQSNTLLGTSGLSLGGGTFSIQQTGTQDGTPNVQTFAGTTLTQGDSNINFTRVSNGVAKVQTGAITRNAGATVFFNGTSAKPSNQFVEVGASSTGSNTLSGIIGGWAFTDQYGFAVSNGNGANVTNAVETASNFSSNTLNTDVTSSFTAVAGATTGSLRFNTAAAETLTLNGANAIDSGGILVTPTTAANTQTITGGTSLTSNNGQDLIVIDEDTNASGSLVINSSIVNNPSNSIGFTKSGPGLVVLGGSNSFSGPVYLNAGTLKLNNANALGSGVNSISFGAATTTAGTLTLNGISPTVASLSSVNNNTGINPILQNANATPATLTLSSNSTTPSTFVGTIQDGGGGGALSITKTGSATQTLGGSLTYSGTTNVSGGTLKLISPLTASTLINIGSNASLNVTGVSGSTLSIGSGQTLIGSGTIVGTLAAGSSSILAPGTGTASTGGSGMLTVGNLNLSAGAFINLGLSSTNPANNLISTAVLTLPTSGSVKLDLFSPGTSTAFATAGTYDVFQDTSVTGGTLANLAVGSTITGMTATFGTSGSYITLTLAASASNYNWTNTLGTSQWTSTGNWSPSTAFPSNPGDGATFSQSNATPGTVNLSSNEAVGTMSFVTTTGSFNVSGSSTLTFDNKGAGATISDTGTNTISAPVALNDNLGVSGAGVLTISSVISESSVGKSLTENGTGTLILTGANSYTGGTSIQGGTIVFSSSATGDGNLGATATPVTIGVGTLQWAAGNTDDISSTRTITFSGGNATLNTNGNNVTLNNPIGNNGAGGLVKAGAGILTLGGSNTYTGNTTITGGALSISTNSGLGNQASGGSLILNGGTLITTATMTLDNGGVNMRAVTLGSAGGSLAPATGTVVSIDGPITGSGSLTISDVGQVTIFNPVAGQNTYSGGTYIPVGTVLTGDTNSQGGGLGTGPVIFNGPSGVLNLKYQSNTSPNYGTFPNNIMVTNGSNGTLITTPRGDVSGTVTGSGTLNIQTAYVRSQFDSDFSAFTGQLNITATVGGQANGGDFRLNSTTGLGLASVNLGAGTNLYDIFNFASTLTESIGSLAGSGELSGGPAAGRTLTWSIGGLNTSTGFTGVIADSTGPTAITKVGTGTLTLSGTDTYSGLTTVNAGTLALASGYAMPSVSGTLLNPLTVGNTLNISSGATVAATNTGSTFGVMVGVLNNSGTFDVGTNLLYINGTTNTLANINSQVAAGYNGGKWNGNSGTGAIVSSAAATDTSHLTAVGAIVNDVSGSAIYSTLDGATLSDGNILVKYTYYGDTDLSGVVDGSDYSRVDFAYLNNQNTANAALTGWYNGDFNYDGVIDGSDYTLMDNAFNQQSAVLSAAIATPTAQIAGAIAGTAVPEPATLGMCAMLGLGLLGRRRRPM